MMLRLFSVGAAHHTQVLLSAMSGKHMKGQNESCVLQLKEVGGACFKNKSGEQSPLYPTSPSMLPRPGEPPVPSALRATKIGKFNIRLGLTRPVS